MVLNKLKTMNIQVFLNSRLQSILVDNRDGSSIFKGLLLEDSAEHAFDIVIFAVGITPCDEVAKSSGIDIDRRRGIIIQPDLKTSADNVFAIGECASLQGKTYGFIAPCIEMASVLAFNLTKYPSDVLQNVTVPDTSTRLKLAGVNVACFGEFAGDTKASEDDIGQPRALSYHDPFSGVYKKYIFTSDGEYLLGGIMVGDISDYTMLSSIVKHRVSHIH